MQYKCNAKKYPARRQGILNVLWLYYYSMSMKR